jgi:hypothetical protein
MNCEACGKEIKKDARVLQMRVMTLTYYDTVTQVSDTSEHYFCKSCVNVIGEILESHCAEIERRIHETK